MNRSTLQRRLHWLRTWAIRWAISWLVLTGFLPLRLQLEFLYWLREDMDPQHRCMDTVLAEIAVLEDAYAA